MAMPTTRYGRYLVYRERAIRRRRRVEKWKARASTPDGSAGHSYTRRELAWNVYGKQEPREYPLNPLHVHGGPFGDSYWRVRPDKGVWGVPEYDGSVFVDPGETGHVRGDFLRYQLRRVASIPRFRLLARLPWRFAVEDVPINEFFPFDTYPSGRPSFVSTWGP